MKYPMEDQYVKLLYVAATRALHELAVVHLNDLTDLIATSVSEEKKLRSLESEKDTLRAAAPRIIHKVTEGEKQDELAKFLERTTKRYGLNQPKKSEVVAEKTAQRMQENLTAKVPQKSQTILDDTIKQKLKISSGKTTQNIQTNLDEKAISNPQTRVSVKLVEQQGKLVVKSVEQLQNKEAAKVSEQQRGKAAVNPELKIQDKSSVKSGAVQITGQAAESEINTSPYQFASVVETAKLTPKGHSRIDCAVRWVKKSKNYIDFVSNYGMLRVIPVTDEIVRVKFIRGQADSFAEGKWNYTGEQSVRFMTRENAAVFEIATKKLVVRVEKKTGALSFLDTKGTLLFKESGKEPRQIEPDILKTWNYFEWAKNERMFAKGILDTDLEQVNGKARYISIGGKKKRMPLLFSQKGYGIAVCAENTVAFCGVGVYGQYICAENETQIDYFVLFGGNNEENLRLYKLLIG